MSDNWHEITAPTAEPLTLAEVKLHLEIADDDTAHDDWITPKITEARESAEEYLERSLTDAEYEMRLNDFCSEIALPLGDIGDVSEISYIDTDGAAQVLDPTVYEFDDNRKNPVLRPAYGEAWPSTRSQVNAVTITFQGRYAEGESPPITPKESIKGAMKMLIAHWFENREGVGANTAMEMPLGVCFKLNPYRRNLGV